MGKRITVERAATLLKEHYGVATVEIKELFGYDDQNFIVTGKLKDKCSQYVFKVTDNTESNRKVFREVSSVIDQLSKRCLPVPSLVRTRSREPIQVVSCNTPNQTQSYVIQLLTYLNGNTMTPVKLTEVNFRSLVFEAGTVVANICNELQNVKCQSDLKREDYRWNIGNTQFCRACYPHIDDKELRQICIQINEQFEEKVLKNISKFRPSLIHGDANTDNIIINTNNNSTNINNANVSVTGIIDFNDIIDSRIVFEIAIFIAYMMCKAYKDGFEPMAVAAKAQQGFESVLPLTSDEKEVLFICVMKRIGVSLCSAFLEKSLGATGEKLKDFAAMSQLAKKLWTDDVEKVAETWLIEHAANNSEN